MEEETKDIIEESSASDCDETVAPIKESLDKVEDVVAEEVAE